MTTFSFFLIYFIVTFCVGIVILVIGTEIESEPQTVLGTLVTIISIISLVITFVERSQTLVPNHVWLLYVIPTLFLFISLFELIDSKHILPWSRDYYKEYRSVTKEYCDLRDKFNGLENN